MSNTDEQKKKISEVSYIMSEMNHAMKQIVLASPVGGRPDMNESQRRDSWFLRATILCDKIMTSVNQIYQGFNDEIHITWTVDDVMFIVPRLTKEQARKVLHETCHNHDAEYGIAWHTFEIFADNMYPDTGDTIDDAQQTDE